ncbi:MAG TPA: hypothetical protein VN812_13780 [Candidatus Acidoferrales bacterium]|nr:hypothetical protein [Candidatus Acidoferrales bacterium]
MRLALRGLAALALRLPQFFLRRDERLHGCARRPTGFLFLLASGLGRYQGPDGVGEPLADLREERVRPFLGCGCLLETDATAFRASCGLLRPTGTPCVTHGFDPPGCGKRCSPFWLVAYAIPRRFGAPQMRRLAGWSDGSVDTLALSSVSATGGVRSEFVNYAGYGA